MNYKTISNVPEEREKLIYSWCYYDDIFTNDELNTLCDYFETNGTEKGTIVADTKSATITQDDQNVDDEIRKSQIKFYNLEPETKWIFDRINFAIEDINNKYYNFDLNGYDHFQYTEYSPSEHYDYHTDLIFDKITHFDFRKLSLTLVLNEPEKDFKGGDFLINTSSERKSMKVPQKRGRIILFPSFMIHKVSPVTEGKRKSLVVWVVGPKFR